MSVTIKIPTPLRTLTAGADEVSVEASTIRAAIDALETQYPGIKDRICDEKGIRRFVNVFANEEDIRFLNSLDTELSDKDVVSIVPAIAGGSDPLR